MQYRLACPKLGPLGIRAGELCSFPRTGGNHYEASYVRPSRLCRRVARVAERRVGRRAGAIRGDHREGHGQGKRSSRARYIGYQAGTKQITLTPGTQTQDFELKFDPMTLDVVVVTGTAGGTEIKKVPF